MLLRAILSCICCLLILSTACKRDKPVTPAPPQTEDSPVRVVLSELPYQKLSDYHFFKGPLQQQSPNDRVLPYTLASTLFTDYALKQRFVWMPDGQAARYVSDHESLDFPIGTVLIKNFYYDNVTPALTRKMLETRLMVQTDTGWWFAAYVWNEAQTEAYLDMAGSHVTVSWLDESGENKNVLYRIPSENECFTCHKHQEQAVAIGPKPQNLNNSYLYEGGSSNQLRKWVEMGYLEDNLPAHIVSTVDYRDASLPLADRARSYLDISCAHCHQEGSHCAYRPLRLAFSETENLQNMGICVLPDEPLSDTLKYIITPGKPDRSILYFRLKTSEESFRMPLLGRSLPHSEGLELLKDYISSLPPCAP